MIHAIIDIFKPETEPKQFKWRLHLATFFRVKLFYVSVFKLNFQTKLSLCRDGCSIYFICKCFWPYHTAITHFASKLVVMPVYEMHFINYLQHQHSWSICEFTCVVDKIYR